MSAESNGQPMTLGEFYRRIKALAPDKDFVEVSVHAHDFRDEGAKVEYRAYCSDLRTIISGPTPEGVINLFAERNTVTHLESVADLKMAL